jgi:hypothetical protein
MGLAESFTVERLRRTVEAQGLNAEAGQALELLGKILHTYQARSEVLMQLQGLPRHIPR